MCGSANLLSSRRGRADTDDGEIVRIHALPVVLLVGLFSACSGGDEDTSSADGYYAEMDIGQFADMNHDELDNIGQAFCDDLTNMDPADRKFAALVIRESVDTDAEATLAARAMTRRWCPEYAGDFE